jgi:hypothetical protein
MLTVLNGLVEGEGDPSWAMDVVLPPTLSRCLERQEQANGYSCYGTEPVWVNGCLLSSRCMTSLLPDNPRPTNRPDWNFLFRRYRTF